MTARIKPLTIYTVQRHEGSLILHAVPVEKESDLFYYLPTHAQPLFHNRARIPKAKAHRSRKAAWLACFRELDANRVYFQSGVASLDAVIAQIPKRMIRAARHSRTEAA